MIFFGKCNVLRLFLFGWLLISTLIVGAPVSAAEKQLSDAEIAKELSKENNKIIIEEFLKYELREVNEYATKPLLNNHRSLEFFIKQAERGPVNNLLFLETQVHKLREAQKNINSLPVLHKLFISGKEENSGTSTGGGQNFLLWHSSYETRFLSSYSGRQTTCREKE